MRCHLIHSVTTFIPYAQNCFQLSHPLAVTKPALHTTVAAAHFARVLQSRDERHKNHGTNTAGKSFSQVAVVIARQAPAGRPFRKLV